MDMYKFFLCLSTLFLVLGCSKGPKVFYIIQNQTNGSEIVEIDYYPPSKEWALFVFATKELKPNECIMVESRQFEHKSITIKAGKGGMSDSQKRLCGTDRRYFFRDPDQHDRMTCTEDHYAIVDEGTFIDDYKLRIIEVDNAEQLLKSGSCTPFEEWSKSGFRTNEAKDTSEESEKS